MWLEVESLIDMKRENVARRNFVFRVILQVILFPSWEQVYLCGISKKSPLVTFAVDLRWSLQIATVPPGELPV